MKIIQTIQIGSITINTIGTSSIFQIGSSGMIQACAETYLTTGTDRSPAAIPSAQELADEISDVSSSISGE